MKLRSRFYILFVWIFFAVIIATTGSWIENYLLQDSTQLRQKILENSIFLFFFTVNLNVILLLTFVFLTFRSGVKLIVDNSQGVFGSKLNTKLVTAFLFFSLLPTVVLLYVSTKFVSTNFEKWLPEKFVKSTEEIIDIEWKYQAQILSFFSHEEVKKNNIKIFDFVHDKLNNRIIHLSKNAILNKKEIIKFIKENDKKISLKPQWFQFNHERMILVKSDVSYIFGIISPKILHNQWTLFKLNYPESQSVSQIIKLSYYVMLGVITLLIVFSATWLGFTIAREITVPMQVLSDATESVAHGNYSVKIDDIVSDDEMGKLALNFRSMVSDLKLEKERVDLFSNALKRKADELSIKSDYNEILLRNVNAAVIVLNQDLMIESWNHRAEYIFKYQEKDAIGKAVSSVLGIDFFRTAIEPSLVEISEIPRKRIELEWSGKIMNTDYQLQLALSMLLLPKGKIVKILFLNDITELAKAQRLAAWRDVARRVAHEIKNPLTPIKLGAQRIEKKFSHKFFLKESEIFHESIKIILQSTESIKILVDEFIKFSRMPKSYLKSSNIVEAVYLSLRGFVGNQENVPLVFELEIKDNHFVLQNEESINSLPVILCDFDRDQITRLFVNLISNAVTVSVEECSPVVVLLSYQDQDKYVKMSVKDFGTGLSAAVKSRIFEPYFSTKKTGTGLGLVIAKQIVDEHHGKIYVTENIPQGTIFTVELPVISSKEDKGAFI
jgi:two-component system nitrogen regulation sensor histidine kinase NtrY